MTVQITTLSNGLRIATDAMSEAESVVVGAWVGVGTRHEPWNANGVAHLVEHMMFKGTKTRSAYALSNAIEKNGGSMNAYTTREETAYHARVLPEDTELATSVIADMLRCSVFGEKEYEREKQVIIQEIGHDLDSPEDYVFDILHQVALPKQKMGRSILGSADVIAKLPRERVLEYVKRYYNASNMVLVATGKVDHAAFVGMVEKYFGSMPRGKAPLHEKMRIASGMQVQAKDIEQLHFVLGFPGPGYHSRDIYATQILSIILGGSASSRLFQKVRERRGLVYTVSSNHSAFHDGGLFQIYAGTDPNRVKVLIPVICQELRDVTQNISASELARAKAQGRASLLMGQESVSHRADALGHQMLTYNREISADEILKKVMALTKEDVQGMAAKLLARRPIVAALGPASGVEDYKDIARRLAA